MRVAVDSASPWWSWCACCREEQAFRNAEAAFHALKHWRHNHAIEFESLSGTQAVVMSERLGDTHDKLLAGFCNAFLAMLHVLRAKFPRDSELAAALLKTAPDFLLLHGSFKGDDPVWSDNFDGTGTNWLGLQLMLIRDELQPACDHHSHGGGRTWTNFIERCLDTQSGAPLSSQGAKMWQEAVFCSALAVRKAIKPVVAPPTLLPAAIPGFVGMCHGCKKEPCVLQ